MANVRNPYNNLINKGRVIYFNEAQHKYTDNLDQVYTSTTTLISKYTNALDTESIALACERIGRNPKHPKYLKYRGKSKYTILKEWKKESEDACIKGTAKHNVFETGIKIANGYTLKNDYINGRIYTIDNIIAGHNYGRMNLSKFRKLGIHLKYPKIYNIIADFVKEGFKVYAEIGVYDPYYLVSGLVDVLLVRGKEFFILDWKTNKAPIRFESGYYEKDNHGNLMLDQFVLKNEYMKYPINNIPDSIGYHYTLQLSIYDFLVESFGFTNIGNILCHIRTIEGDYKDNTEVEEIKFVTIKYLKKDVENLFKHHYKKIQSTKNLFSI